MGCDFLLVLAILSAQFQSTHPCGVRHNSLTFSISNRCFNPRTRVGCDEQTDEQLAEETVSIHAPVWGATFYQLLYGSQFIGFNPRTRVGCDMPSYLQDNMLSVSIHAPVWGATIDFAVIDQIIRFNPRTRVGCDRLRVKCSTFLVCFNPRTRVGCDKGQFHCSYDGCVSIHAPVWGATITLQAKGLMITFQSTHPCGVRPVS